MKNPLKKVLAILLAFVLIMSLAACSANQKGIDSDKRAPTNSSNSLSASSSTMSAYIPSVNRTADNLRNDVRDGSLYQTQRGSIVLKSADVKNDKISISGSVNGKAFQVEGEFCSISENENVVVFNTKDTLENFRVVYCAVEKNITDSALYFRSFSDNHREYSVVTKLYLTPFYERDYILIETFSSTFPEISKEAIAALPVDHDLNQYWYVREFEPTSVSTEEDQVINRAGNPSYGILESYTYNNLGYYFKHYMRFWEDCDIRDVSKNQSSTASATIRISDKWIDSDAPNSSSTTSSTLSLREVSLVYLTRTGTAVTTMLTTGSATQNGKIVTSFSFDLGVGVKTIAAAATLSFTWQPGGTNKSTGVTYSAYTNVSPNYWREAEGKMKSGDYLNSIGNKYVASWTYSDYSNASSSGSASLAFKYYVDNLLSYSNGHYGTDTRAITVNIV